MTIAAAFEHSQLLGLALELGALAAILGVGVRLPWLMFFGAKKAPADPALVSANRNWAMVAAALLCFVLGVSPGMVNSLLPYQVDFQPYSAFSVLQALTLSGFSVLAYTLAKPLLAPVPGRLVDFDLLYRGVGRAFYSLISIPLASLDGFWSEAYRAVGLRALMDNARFSAVFDRKGIDGMVDGTAKAAAHLGRVTAEAQGGKLQIYLNASAVLAAAIFAVVWLLT
jgi:multicomponent Na+:H+ antiporter subunit D